VTTTGKSSIVRESPALLLLTLPSSTSVRRTVMLLTRITADPLAVPILHELTRI